MKQTSANEWVLFKKCLVLLLTICGLSLNNIVSAHRVEMYTATGCVGNEMTDADRDTLITRAFSTINGQWKQVNALYAVPAGVTSMGISIADVVASSERLFSFDNISYQPSSNLTLGDRIWFDANKNGINENTENGISGVTVHLYKDDNNDNYPDTTAAGVPIIIASTTTNATGYYSFTNLSSGNYIVGVVTPSGYMLDSVNSGDPDNDINLDNNGIYAINGGEAFGWAITLTNSNNTYDFGFCQSTTSSTFCKPNHTATKPPIINTATCITSV